MTASQHEPVPTAYACRRCGRRDGLDAVAPNPVWAEITEGTLAPSGEVEGARWPILCLWCMDEIAAEKGIKASLSLHFAGRALFGTSTSDADQEFINRLVARAETAEKRRESLKTALAELRAAQNEMGSAADAVTVAMKAQQPPAWGMLQEYSARLDAAERKADALLTEDA